MLMPFTNAHLTHQFSPCLCRSSSREVISLTRRAKSIRLTCKCIVGAVINQDCVQFRGFELIVLSPLEQDELRKRRRMRRLNPLQRKSRLR